MSKHKINSILNQAHNYLLSSSNKCISKEKKTENLLCQYESGQLAFPIFDIILYQLVSRKINYMAIEKRSMARDRETSNVKYIRKAIDRKHMYYMYLRTLSIVSLINNSAAFPRFKASSFQNFLVLKM